MYLANDNENMSEHSYLLQQCHGIYSCMNEAGESIVYPLGAKG